MSVCHRLTMLVKGHWLTEFLQKVLMSLCHSLTMLMKGLNTIVSLVDYACERFKCHCVIG